MMEYGKGFLIVIAYFTRIPIGFWIEFREDRFVKGVHLFPFVGLVLSLAQFFLLIFLGFFWGVNEFLYGVLFFLVYLLLTGGLHMDGLADSVDGFYSGRTKERMLEIMSDPHIGTFGVLSLLMISFLDIAAVVGMTSESSLFLACFFPYVGRVMAYTVASFLPYAKEEGMGKTFVDSAHFGIAAVHIFIMLFFFLSLLSADLFYGDLSQISVPIATAFLASVSAAFLSRRKIGGLTGDSMGMIIEISQTAYLLALLLFD